MDNSPFSASEDQAAATVKASVPEIPEHLNAYLDDQLAIVRSLIINEARSLAKRSNRETLEPNDIAEAATQFAPGKRFPGEPKFWQRIASSISAITLISAVLAIVFGVIGAFAGSQPANASGYFDIAKLFAGAIVGSSGANIAAARRNS